MRVIETVTGSRAMWMPNIRSPRYALVAGMSLVPVLVLPVRLLLKAPDATSALLTVALVVCGAIPPLVVARSESFFITRDFALNGARRKPSRKVRRTDVVLVRYRGEFGELIGQDGAILLSTSRLLTRQQVSEIAAYLHVPFSASAPAEAPRDSPGAFVLRPDRGKVIRNLLFVGLLGAGGIALGAVALADGFRSAAIFTIGVPLVLVAADVVWLRGTALVVTDEAVYKGTHNRSKHVPLAEIAQIVYGPRFLLNAANGSTLLSVDASFFTAAQAQALADRFGVPLRRVSASKSRST
jgi:hypothetical protein